MDSGEKTATLQNPKIYAAIAGVISDCGFVSKDKVNKQQGFKYRKQTQHTRIKLLRQQQKQR